MEMTVWRCSDTTC